MYRDDHEAALARMKALETELAAHASDDRKLAALTREVADARARLERAEAELRRMRSTATPRATAPSPRTAPTPSPVTAPEPERLRSPIITLVVLFGGLGALCAFAAVAKCHRETEHAAAPAQATPPPAVSGDRMLAEGVERATELAPGAELVAIEATGVHADGSLDPEYGELAVELVRDHGPEPIVAVDPSTPIGAPRPEHVYLRHDCIRLVYTHGRWKDQSGITMDIERLHSCFDTFETHPRLRRRCSIAQIWQRSRGVAPATAIAKLTLGALGWTFTIDDPRLHVERHERDDCRS